VPDSSTLEVELEQQLDASDAPPYVREHRFYGREGEKRRFRFDFAWPERKIAAEVDGGTFNRGRHTRPTGYAKDAEKNNLAIVEGWRVLRFDQAMVKNGIALAFILEALRRL
jgi:very-short-patch-repair endonuclease